MLVNNAGVNALAHRVNIHRFPTQEWDRSLKVDLTGLFLVSRSSRPGRRSRESQEESLTSPPCWGSSRPGCRAHL